MAAPESRLPVQLTSFVGREREIAQARALLERTRLLTLTGAGGSGKTRLALELAARVAGEYEHGVQWIELAPLSDPTLLPSAVSSQLGIREEPGRTSLQALLEFLKARPLLLVLDNCEHLIEACATLADTLLRRFPRLTLLATSREALGVAGENAFLVPPLSLPRGAEALSPERLAEYEAVQLFVDRARFVLPAFGLTDVNAAAVAQICRRLDGIPLAIELAAARVKVLTPEQIAERLDNAFSLLTSGARTALPRHRTLRAAIDWSYALLPEPERRLIERLSVFAGGCTLEAAESVCVGEGVEGWEVLDLLTALVDKSLVVMEEHEGSARYHLLETVRQYAFSRLEETGETAVLQRRHAEFFLALVEEAEPHLGSPRRHPWLERLRPEHDNLRAALAWSAQAAEEINLRMVGALYWFWFLLGFWSEGRRWMAEALALPAAERSAGRANALLAAGSLAFWGGEAELGQAWLEESRDLWSELGDTRRQAHAALYVGMCTLSVTQDPALARPAVEAAVAGFEAVGDRWGLIHAYNGAGALLLLQQQVAQASEVYQKCAAIARDLGENLGLAIALHGVGETARRQGELDRAAGAFREAIAALHHEHDEMFIARTLEALAFLVVEQGGAQDAARLVGAAQSLRETIGAPVIELDRALHRESIAAIRARLGEEAFAAALAEGRALTRAQAIEFALQEPGSASPLRTPPAAHAATAEPSAAAASASPPPSPSPSLSGTGEARTPAALRVLALGPLQIYLEGEPLPADAWPTAKPRELFFYLLSHPEGRNRQQIALDLWPDASPAQVRNGFHVTLHHLRRALGRPEWVIFGEERYRINPEIGYEFDATLFERQIPATLREVRAGTGSADALRAALALYRGDFLQEEVVGDWHLEMRDHLSRLYVEGLSALGELLMQSEAYAEAAGVYQQLVRKEDLHEEAHRRLILCLARSGERARALRHYERLVTLLRVELDTTPEEETTELYERLRQAEAV